MVFWRLWEPDVELTLDDASAAYWSMVQERLAAHGLWDKPIDGEWSGDLDLIVRRFKATNGLRSDRSLIGPLTRKLLMSEPDAPATGRVGGEPPWMNVARGYIGLKEVPGAKHEPTILRWWRSIGATWFTDDEIPWCGAFVGGVLKEAGIEPLGAAEAPRARAWEKFGRELSGPAQGAIVTFWRGSPRGSAGHVGFVVGRDRSDVRQARLMVLGGNQGDAVTIAPFDRERITSFRWPDGHPMPRSAGWGTLPIIGATGAASSTNEA